jgi:hypothetical protein
MYVTVEQVRERGSGITPSGAPPATDDVLTDVIEQASRIFDLQCGVKPGYFEAAADDAEPSTKVFYGDGGTLLKLDPYVPGTLDETITVPEGYTAQTFIEGDGYLIRADSAGIPIGTFGRWDGWNAYVPVTVTAVWGFESTPADVKQAVIELAINLWRETDPASLKLVNLEGGVLRESTPPRVKEIARRYRANQAAFI